MITELLVLPHSRLRTHSLPWTKSSILSLPQCSIYNTEVRLDPEDAGRKVTRERNLLLNLRSFLLEGYRSCNETRALQDGSPCLSVVAITWATILWAPCFHNNCQSGPWNSRRPDLLCVGCSEERSDCCLNTTVLFFFSFCSCFSDWKLDRVVTSIPRHWCIRGEKPGKEKGHAERLLGTPAPFYSLTWLVTWIFSWSFTFLLYFRVLYTFPYFVLFHHFEKTSKNKSAKLFLRGLSSSPTFIKYVMVHDRRLRLQVTLCHSPENRTKNQKKTSLKALASCIIWENICKWCDQ